MRRLFLLVNVICFLFLFVTKIELQAQLYTGIIDAQRATTGWATAGVVGGIPTTWTRCTTGTGTSTLASSSTIAQINTALSGCDANHYVELGSGTFTLAGALKMQSNVALKGQGMATKLNFTSYSGSNWYWGGASGVFLFVGSYATPSEVVPPLASVPASTIKTWSGTDGNSGVYTKGSTVINISNTSGLSVGDELVCWQSDATDGSLPSTGYFISDKTVAPPGINAIAGFGEYNDHDGAQEQRSLVTSISGSSVTIADPLVHPTGTWATGNSPKCGWLTSSQLIKNSGVENLWINTITLTTGQDCVICVAWGYNIWVKNVGITPRYLPWHSTGAVNFVTTFNDSLHVEFVNNWMGRAQGGGASTTTSYGVVFQETHFSKAVNNIFDNVESPTEVLIGSLSNVYAYNYEHYVGDDMQEGGIQVHDVAAAMNLIEGNHYYKMFADNWHGNTVLNTFFRNYMSGNGFDVWAYHRWWNIVGNVLTASSAYEALSTGSPLRDRFYSTAFRLGYPSYQATVTALNDGSGSPYCYNGTSSALDTCGVGPDSRVQTSMMRWGNYVTFDSTSHFTSGEVPTGDALFPNAEPADHTLPNSFYLSAKPDWWGSVAWPPTGPDVTGGNITGTGGHANKIPSQVCYEATASGSIANFAPDTCYTTVACTPSKVVFTAQPSNAVQGVSVGTITVAVQDSGSATCTSDTSTVTLAKTGGTCTGMTLNGTVSGSASSGVFTTSDVNLTVATGGCTLTATDGSLTSAVSNSFTISSSTPATGSGFGALGLRRPE